MLIGCFGCYRVAAGERPAGFEMKRENTVSLAVTVTLAEVTGAGRLAGGGRGRRGRRGVIAE